MNETYNFIRDLMFGRKPLHRENPTAGQSEWYYMTPKNPNDLDNSEFDFVDVPTQNTPNPLLGGNLANAAATPVLPSETNLLKTGWQNQYNQQNNLTPVTTYNNDIYSGADNLQQGILNQAAFNQPFLRPASNIPSIPVPPRKPHFTDYSLYGDDMSRELIDNMLNDTKFQQVMLKTRQHEGGYNNAPNDRGGETNFGISSRWYPDEDIKNLTRERADAILYRDYWLKNGIYQLPEPLVDVVFDTSLPSGNETVIPMVHKSLGVTPGTIIGNQTTDALQNVDINSVKKRFMEYAEQNYNTIVKKYPSQRANLSGWLNRLHSYQ